MSALHLFAVVTVAAGLLSATAVEAKSPHAIVAGFYKPYLADPHADKTGGASDTDLMLPYATRELKALIWKDRHCEEKSQGICNLDADILINGQDWDISHFALTDGAIKGHHQTITARFINGGPNKVDFSFVIEHGVWKLDDVEATAYAPDGKVNDDWWLKATLSGAVPK